MQGRVSFDSFVRYDAFHPWGRDLSLRDRLAVVVMTVALGVLTCGLFHVICKRFFYERQFAMLPQIVLSEMQIVPYQPPQQEKVVEVIVVIDNLPPPSTPLIEEVEEEEPQEEVVALEVSKAMVVVEEVVTEKSPADMQKLAQVVRTAVEAIQNWTREEEEVSPTTLFASSCAVMFLCTPKLFFVGSLAGTAYSYYRQGLPEIKEGDKLAHVVPATFAIVGAAASLTQCAVSGGSGGFVGRIVLKIIPLIGAGCGGRTFLKIRAYIAKRFTYTAVR